MKLLYTNGDSWTAGDEIVDYQVTDSDSIRYYNTWPWLLSQKLNIPMCINDSLGGTSNARIFRRTNDFIFRWIARDKNPADLTVVIGWTTPERSEIGAGEAIYPIQIQGYLRLNSNPVDEKSLRNYHKSFYEVYSDAYGEQVTSMYMVNLRLLCKSLGIRFYDFVAIGKHPQHWQEQIKHRWGLELKDMYMNGTWSQETNKNKWPTYKYGHPTIETQGIWADTLSEKLL